MDIYSKKLIRLVTKGEKDKPNYYIRMFDIESEMGSELQINPKLFFFDGMSQIYLDNTLYLCGSGKNLDEYSSSFLYSINLIKQPLTVNIEVNSCHSHHYPALAFLRQEYLITIGGLNSKKCEFYSITTKRWKDLPVLPEERYQANVLCDNTANAIYVIGGLDSITGQCYMSVLKLNMNLCVKWDTIVLLNNEADLVAKANCCVVKRSNDTFLILGGCNNNSLSEGTDAIIEIDIRKKKIIPVMSVNKLSYNVKFKSLRKGVENKLGTIFAFDEDDDNLIYKIDSTFTTIIKFNSDDSKLTEI